MKCPVGHPGEIPDDALSCPICGVDLSALQRVRQLHIVEYNEAVRLAESGAVDLALTRAMASLSWDGHYVPAITLVGKLLWQKNRFREAMERWRQAASLSPDDKEIKGLISDGRAFLERRRLRRIFYATAAALVMVVTFIFLPLYALMSADKKISDLAVTVSNINDKARTLSEEQVTISSRIEAQADVARNFKGTIDKLRDELKAEISKLNEKSFLLSEEQAMISSRIEVQADEFRNFEGTIDKLQDELRTQILKLNEKAGALSDRQSAIASETKSNIDDIRTVTGTVQKLEKKLIAQTSTLEASVSRYREAIVGVVEGLRPTHMNELEEKISRTRKELAEVKNREENLRNPSNPLDVIKHRSAKRDLRECKERLQVLKNEWEKDIVPWIRIKEKTESVWETGNSEG